MTPHLAGALRTAFEELAETAPAPVGLAQTALVTARRQRVARLAVGGGFAAAICVALIGVVAVIAPVTGTDGDQFADSGLRPLVVTAYSGIRDPKVDDPSPNFQYSLLLNVKTGRYDRVPYRYAMPSPDGGQVLVATGDNSLRYPTRVGVLDRATGNVRWITDSSGTSDARFPGYSSDGRWSPDGQRILLTYMPRTGTPGFLLVDSETLTTTFVPLPDLAAQNEQVTGLLWTPDSNGLALTLSMSVDDPTVAGIRFYDLAGRVVRTVPAGGGPLDEGSFFPDGRQLALASDPDGVRQTSVTVIDPVTGSIKHSFTVPLSGDLIGWRDHQHLLIRVFHDQGGIPASDQPAPVLGPGDDEYDRLLVVDLTGRVTHSMHLPAERAEHLFTGSSAGLAGSAAKITF
ncbi:TolB family protein [Plantactinospora sp. CA-294935]|uniref:TolB family protein n=1 Tax=Plantactinospora sp. CA-294935 TaxID=3240012 RepID=UPI003D8F74DA